MMIVQLISINPEKYMYRVL